MAKKGLFKFIGLSLLLFLVLGAGVGFVAFRAINGPNVSNDQDEYTLYIPQGSNFEEVVASLNQQKILLDESTFRRIAQLKKYPQLVKAGKFKLKGGWSNMALVNHLRSGKQEPVKVVINQVRTLEKFAGAATRGLQADSSKLLQLVQDPQFVDSLGFEKESVIGLFLPDTYEFFWNTNEKQIVARLVKEYKKFWNEKRLKKAEGLKMTPKQVSTLAAIVEEETYHNDEMDDVAEVYLNRIERGMALEADPTVKYAVGDFAIRRVLTKHLQVDSPYNTYKYPGLPPGPICLPSKQAIEAVLNPAEHDYIYFCAKDDFSMYHAFAKNHRQHVLNAKRYHAALNRKRIFK